MAKNGLNANDYSYWIDEHILIDDGIKKIIEEFVLGTPAQGLSRKGRNLYDYFQLQTETDYCFLFSEMFANLPDVFFADTYDQLRDKLINHSWLGFNMFPTDVTEAVYLYVGRYNDDDLYKAYFSHLPAIPKQGMTNEKRQAQAEPREIIARVNKLFYHLRNSIAHGCYGIFEGEETFFIFQDESKDHFVSARIILKETRLLQWIDLLQSRKNANCDSKHIAIKEAM